MTGKYTFDFKPEELMMRVREHSILLERMQQDLDKHLLDDKENFQQVRDRMERLAEATEKLDDSIDKLIHQTQGAMWASTKFWSAIVFFSGLSFSLAKFVSIGS